MEIAKPDLEYFGEILPSAATLILKIKGVDERTNYEFKSEDGSFFMVVSRG